MIRTRLLVMSAAWVVLVTPVISAQEPPGVSVRDLSRYREFQLGMNLVTVAQQSDITAEARVIHRRPELIQDLMWLPAPARVPGALTQGDSARKVLFSFYNDQLFRIVVTYDRERTEGLTAEDMVEAISGDVRSSHVAGDQEWTVVGPSRERQRQTFGVLGRLALFAQPLPVLVPVRVWSGSAVKAPGHPGAGCDRRSDPAR